MNTIVSKDDVVHALSTVLQDPKFAAAPQMSAFLRFVVLQTLEGNSERIKAYTIAVDALGKPDTFDPQNDPSVRVLAKRLRDTMTAYYERTSGHNVFIRLHTGSYVPEFEAATDVKDTTSPEIQNITPVVRNNQTNETLDTGITQSSAANGTETLIATNKTINT